MSFDANSIFISYAWGGNSEEVVNELDQIITSKGLPLIRDKRDLGFKGLIKDFMKKIGKGNFVILVISDKYLKSPNCMFELIEVQKHGDIYNRVFPLVLNDAKIYKPLDIISYLKYWENQIEELNNALKDLGSFADTQGIRDDIDLFTDIRGAIAQIATTFRDMNTLSIDEMKAKNYSPLIDLLLKKSETRIVPEPKPVSSSRKYGKVLYHIPEMMQIESWTRCIVRLAWDELLLKEGLNLPDNSEVIEEIRLGKVMQVSLEEGKDGENFEINPLSSTEQFIFDDDFTEWLFDVKAKKEGTFTLILRVTLLQIIEGFGERKKDIVLERNVKTEAFVPEALPEFEVAQNSLANEKDETRIYPELSEELNSIDEIPRVEAFPSPSSIHQEQPIGPKAKPKSILRKMMPYAASIIVILIAAVFLFPEFQSSRSPLSANEELAMEKPRGVQEPFPNEEVLSGAPERIDETMLISISVPSQSKSSASELETKLFIIKRSSLDSLQKDSANINFSPRIDSTRFPISEIKIFSALEIKDSIKKSRTPMVKPVVKNNLKIQNN